MAQSAGEVRLLRQKVLGRKLYACSGASWLRALINGNLAGTTIPPNSFFDKLLDLERGKFGGSKSIPKEIAKLAPLFTGTLFVIGEKDKPLGEIVENKCEKTVIYKPSREDASLVNTILLCDQGFLGNGTPLVEMLNALNDEPLLKIDDIVEAPAIRLKFNGETRRLEIKEWNGNWIKAGSNGKTSVWHYYDANIGLLVRSFLFGPFTKEFYDVSFTSIPNTSGRGSVLYYVPETKRGLLESCAKAEKAGSETKKKPKAETPAPEGLYFVNAEWFLDAVDSSQN